MPNTYNLSIIIPISHGGKKYIDHIIPKLIETKPVNSEIVIVNADADNQKSLKKYSKDITIISIEKDSGVSRARNIGIEKTSGKFFTFLDIDDDFEPKILQKMLDTIEKTNSDLCIANYDEIAEKNRKTTASKYNYYSGCVDGNLKEFLVDKIGPAVWDKIYRRSSLGSIRFNETLSVGEDILYILNIFLKNPRVVFLDDIYYHYIQHEKSVMHTINPHLLDFLSVPEKIPEKDIKKLKQYPKEWKFFQLEMYTRTIHSISNSYKTDRKNAKLYLKRIYDKNTLESISKNPYYPKTTRIEMKILKTFGINFHLFLMPFYQFTKRLLRR